MARVSERISAVMTGVRCPGCGQFVTPTIATPGEAAEAAPTGPGKRWSFVWRPPSGEVCPSCGFPLARFARRLKWMWCFRVGVVLLMVAFALLLVQRYGGSAGWLGWALRLSGGVGLVAVAVGVVGLIVGGRRGDDG